MAASKDSPHLFDDHGSLSASLEDFAHNERSPVFGLPSQHSGFRSEESESEDDPVSDEPWSPPAWRQQNNAGGWYKHQPYPLEKDTSKASMSASRSRGTSPQYDSAIEDDGDLTIPANIPLPKGSVSPAKERSPQPSSSPLPQRNEESDEKADESSDLVAISENPNNYFRFALRAEVQQRTEPIEAALNVLRAYATYTTKTWNSVFSTVLIATLAVSCFRVVTHTPSPPPVPDLVKVAGLARSFEPLIFYSENGVRQIGDLQETGVAVWDLGESVRYANMTSAPLICNELDALSESLKSLAIEMTKFFANVDGDIDSILIVMDWAKRELSTLSSFTPGVLSSAFINVHTLLSNAGFLQHQSTGLPTAFGKFFTSLFGSTHAEHKSQTLHRTFNEFLGVLEESINAELNYATALFALFENIDRQFLNLQRTVIRELDTQERLESEFLGSLWTRLVSRDQQMLRKYEKNKQLLTSVRQRTTQNKSLLMDHNAKLIALKGNLETLRRKLVSPLVRRKDGSTIGVEEQIRGLEGTYEHLRRVREKQKERMLETVYGAGSRRSMLSKEEALRIDA